MLVGRDTELAAIDRALDTVGTAPVTLRVSGEPGIGKSRLLSELAARADERGLLVLEGAAAEFERGVPFAVFADAVDDYLAAAGPAVLDGFDSAARGRLSAVFPAVSAQSPDTIHEERYRIHRDVRQLLTRLAPLVLVLDDLHWADPASAELLGYLLQHTPPAGVLLALGDRPAQLADRLRIPLERGRTITIRPRPLSRTDASTLIGRQAVDRLYAETGGNPFYLLELSRAAVPTGDNLPSAVVAAIDQELGHLPEPARALAHGAAVAGEPFEIGSAAVAAGLTERQALEQLDLLVGTALVRATDVPRRFVFRHPLVRHAVYESAGPGWRIGAHRRLAEALRARGVAPVELAHHLRAAAEPGDQDAAAVLVAAGNQIVNRAPQLAAQHFEAALRLVPRELDLLLRLAAAHRAAGQFADSHQTLLEALTLVGPDRRPELEAVCARVEYLLGRHTEADQRLRKALTALPDRRSKAAATLLIELVSPPWSTGWESVRDLVLEAAALGRDLGDRPVEAAALALLAFGDLGTPQAQDGADLVQRASDLVDATGDPELSEQLGTLYHLARGSATVERYHQAIRHADRGAGLARQTGHGEWLVATLTWRGVALHRLGRLTEATETAEEALDSARLSGHDTLVSWALQSSTLAATARGDLAVALETGAESVAINRRFGSALIAATDSWIYGEALLEAGQPDRCVAVVLDAAGGPQAEHLPLAYKYRAWHLLARAEVERGRLSSAADWIGRLDTALPGLGELKLPVADTERARAQLLLAQGRPDQAARAATRAAEAAAQVHANLDTARAWLLAGRAFGAAGDRDRAVELLDQARAALELYGATRYHDEAVRELRRLGVRIGRGGRRGAATGPGIDALSDREREIATLVAAGRTNKEIGAALFVSVRTVERHLSHIFGKLEVSSRAQLGALIGDPNRD